MSGLRKACAAAAAAVGLGLAAPAMAVPVDWDIDATINGAAFTGAFTYDADLNDYTLNELVFGGTPQVNLSVGAGADASSVLFLGSATDPAAILNAFQLEFDVPLSNVGGVVALTQGSSNGICVVPCVTPIFFNSIEGSVSADVSNVPLPAPAALLLSALMLAGWRYRRQSG